MNDLERFAELELTMQELLSGIHGDSADAAQLLALNDRCQELGAVLGNPETLGEGLDAEGITELTARLERLIRLNAIAREAVEGQRSRLGSAITQVRRSGKDLARYGTLPDSGASCDLEG